MALSPPAYLPELSVKGMSISTPARAPAGGSLQLTPANCAGAACTGFRVSNAPDFSSRTNTATFTPMATTALVDPDMNMVYELATFQLNNGGFMVPADAGASSVPITLSLNFASKGASNKSPTPVTLPFLVMWSPGSPAPVNTAGLFVLVTKQSGSTPAPFQQFSVALTSQTAVNLKLELLGFKADATNGKDVTVLGDWGQQPPAAGQPGPRVFVKPGAGSQTVKLVGRITRLSDATP